jgi:hypothetical protein
VSELNLSADASRCRWRCYLLLLSLASKAKKNVAADSELCEGHESVTGTEANRLSQSQNHFPEAGLGQTGAEVEAQAKDDTASSQSNGSTAV